MKFILEGNFDLNLLDEIKSEDLSVTHIIVHVPNNPIGNGSIFFSNHVSFEEFEKYTKRIQELGIIPIAGLDSTCQGNFEAHAEHYKAIKELLKLLHNLKYKNILLSSPNNIAFFKENFSEAKLFLSYSQCVTSTNRARIFSGIGAHSIILHPDIIRSFEALKSFIEMQDKSKNSKELEFTIPLNIGCNWGCIYWYQHHNLQSHKTINSPVFPNQTSISDVKNEEDYPILKCWKQRLEHPEKILKSGWVSPFNINRYQDLGFNSFLLLTYYLSNKQIITILKSYISNYIDSNFFDYVRIPYPAGEYWDTNIMGEPLFRLESDSLKIFCDEFPYYNHYPSEQEINNYINKFKHQIKVRDIPRREKILGLIREKIKKIERGTT